jgi:serine protease Do
MNLPEAIDTARPYVVQIRLGEGHVAGTGFFVHPEGYVITAEHVVGDESRVSLGLAQPNTENIQANFTLVDATVVDRDQRHDLALLRTEQNPFAGEVTSGFGIGDKQVPLLYGIAPLDVERTTDGVAVAISGYPLGNAALVTNSGAIASAWAWDMNSDDHYLADTEVNPGNSGGPVYRVADAVVIGICVATQPAPVRDDHGEFVRVGGRRIFYSSGITKVIPATGVAQLLERHFS